MNFGHYATQIALYLLDVFADLVVWSQYTQTRLVELVKNFTCPKAIALHSQPGGINKCNKAQVHYRIGVQKYTVIVDNPVERRLKINYAAFEYGEHALFCTELLESLAGPNGDFHKRTIRPKDILTWYFPKVEWECVHSSGTLSIIFSDSSTLDLGMDDIIPWSEFAATELSPASSLRIPRPSVSE